MFEAIIYLKDRLLKRNKYEFQDGVGFNVKEIVGEYGRSDYFFQIYKNGDLAGQAYLEHNGFKNEYEINLTIHPEFRGQRLTADLLEQIKIFAKENDLLCYGTNEIEELNEGDSHAKEKAKVYGRHGFRNEWGEDHFHYR